MTLYTVEVNDGTGWQDAASFPVADDARAVALWYRQRRLRSRVTFTGGRILDDDARLSVAVERMIREEGGA